jgi:hypothetical protein
MKEIDAYCSVCNHAVRVVLTDAPVQDASSPIHESEVVCLEIGEHCSGTVCPQCAAPQLVMGARLVRNGLQTEVQPIVRGRCIACENIADFVVVSREHAICAQCGTTAERAKIELVH